MKKNLLIYLVLFSFIIISSKSEALSQETFICPGSANHTELLKYATIAERVYGDSTVSSTNWRAICRDDIAPDVNNFRIENLPDEYFDRAKQNLIHLEPDIEMMTNLRTGLKYFSCDTNQNLVNRFLIAFRYILNNEELSLIVKILLVISNTIPNIEELEVLTLHSQSGDTILGVQGTDITRIPQINTSIQQLINQDGSCLFNFATEVAGEFFDICDEESPLPCYIRERAIKYAIVGHSLGGAVTQHVSGQRNFEGIVRECNNNAEFRAYAFNSIGVTEQSTNRQFHETVTSVRFSGEILEYLQNDFQTTQIGDKYIYGISNNISLSGFERHKIVELKKEIGACRCENGRAYTFERY